MSTKPLFSVIHPTARPDKWASVLEAWFRACGQGDFEYSLVCDTRWGFNELPSEPPVSTGIVMGGAYGGNAFRAVWNTGKRCYVDAVNIGAQYATGDVIIVIADDQYPCAEWDVRLAEALADSGKEVIEVSTGTPQEHERAIHVMPILTRARYERLGYLLYPEYESLFSDNDFCEMARRDHQVADARQLMFPHRHPMADPAIPTDAVYEAQSRLEAHENGAAILNARRKVNFGTQPKRKKIAVLMPGESFSAQWVTHTMSTLAWLGQFFDYECHSGYCSNVYVSRTTLARAAAQSDADYVLWIDDDNPITPADVKYLILDLEQTDIDIIAGWCGCHSNINTSAPVQTSVGCFGENDVILGADPKDLLAAQGLVKIDWTGFPIVVMRRETLAKLLPEAFQPLINPFNPYGFDSEDIAFSKRARAAGMKLACDSRVKVPHLKLRDADQVPAPAGDFTSKEKQ